MIKFFSFERGYGMSFFRFIVLCCVLGFFSSSFAMKDGRDYRDDYPFAEEFKKKVEPDFYQKSFQKAKTKALERMRVFESLKRAISSKSDDDINRLCDSRLIRDVINHHDESENKKTLLHMAVLAYSDERERGPIIIQKLLDNGADVFAEDGEQVAPLFYAFKGRNKGIIFLLQQYMVDGDV